MRPIFSPGALLASVALVALAGCQTVEPAPAPAGPKPVVINPGYQAGYLQNLDDRPVPSLEQMIARAPGRARAKATPEDVLRAPAFREAALAYGIQGGLAWESKAINKLLQARSAELTRIYDFSRVLIEAPGHAKILPPVISQSNENWETADAGRTLRVADTYYEIVEQARFVPNAPLWQTYLVRSYKSPEAPDPVLLPKDGGERQQWAQSVRQGWDMGREQANEIFKVDTARLERDLGGMIRYKQLLEEGKVDPPSIADAQLGTTGSGNDMRVNDRAVTITKDPKLKVTETGEWRAPATTPGGAGGFETGVDPSRPAPRRNPDASVSEVQAAVEATRPGPPRSADAPRQAW